jgi:ribose-phosphate pyrophosphokinase
LGLSKAFIDKHRNSETLQIDASQIIGQVEGKVVISFDDIIQSGSTVANGVLTLKRKGAKKVYILVVHPDFSAKTIKRLNPLLEDGILDGLVVVDTIPIDDRDKWHKNLVVLDPAPLIADVITHLHEGKPLRPLFLQME